MDKSTLLGYDVASYIHSALSLVPSSNSVPVIRTWAPLVRALATIELVAFDIALASEVLTSWERGPPFLRHHCFGLS